MTIWQPKELDQDRPLYLAISDKLADDIIGGHLTPETKLPPMRQLAKALGVTVGTVNRAYRAAEKRGLVISEVGKGTFVRSNTHNKQSVPLVLPEHSPENLCNLTLNAPVHMDISHYLSKTFSTLSESDIMGSHLQYGDTKGKEPHRLIINKWLESRQVDTRNGETILTHGGQQGLACVLSALTQPGDTVLVEELTYSGAKNLAKLHGLILCPVAMDDDGLLPQALEKAALETGANVLICMPSLHNPTTRSMTLERRKLVVEVSKRRHIKIIEDDVYIRDDKTRDLPTLQCLLPEQTFHVSSFSKVVAPGLRFGSITVAKPYSADIISAAQTSSWMASPIIGEMLCHWLEIGIVDDITRMREKRTAARVQLARRCLSGLNIESSLTATHIWLHLSHPWKADTFAFELNKKGLVLTPQSYFSTNPLKPSTAVRLCIGLVNSDELLEKALRIIAATAKCPPGTPHFGF